MTLGLVELLADDAVSAEAALRRRYEPLLEMGDTSFLARIAALLAEAGLSRHDSSSGSRLIWILPINYEVLVQRGVTQARTKDDGGAGRSQPGRDVRSAFSQSSEPRPVVTTSFPNSSSRVYGPLPAPPTS
jgi:hypothetical protein